MYSGNTEALTELTKVLGNQSQKMRAEMYNQIRSETVSNNSSKTHRF